MATSGRGSGVVGYNVQSVVEAEHHLIVAHEVVTTGSDRQQLAAMSERAKAAMGVDALEMLADRGYFSGEEIVACEAIGVTPYVPKPLTSGAKADGRFGKQDFTYLPGQDAYRCPAGETLARRMTTVEKGLTLHRYWNLASCGTCALKAQCTPAKERRVTRWEHEAVIDAMQRRMDLAPQSPMKARRLMVEHPFGTIKAWMGSTHFLMKRLGNVRTEIGLHVLAYNLKRAMQILGAGPLMAAMQA
jgi:transposase